MNLHIDDEDENFEESTLNEDETSEDIIEISAEEMQEFAEMDTLPHEEIKVSTDENDTEISLFEEKQNLSKHKHSDKHRLSYDKIFKGKKETISESDEHYMNYGDDKFELDSASQAHFETVNYETYIREKQVKERVYSILETQTELNFDSNRRKPSRQDFNIYYELLLFSLKEESFSKTEIFNELSYYFSDNLFNMFKLLSQEHRNVLISELQGHIGKLDISELMELLPKNIKVGTELEFRYLDLLNKEKHYTGVVIEIYKPDTKYRINSYENYYDIDFEDIIRILNNTKYRYNLNKLNNIDFL